MSRLALLLAASISLAGMGADRPAAIADKPADRSVILAFMADWCEPCQKMRPVLAELKREGYPIEFIDVDQSRHLANIHDIDSLPTVIGIDDYGERWRQVGAASEDELRDELSKLPRKPWIRDRAPEASGPPVDVDLPDDLKVEHLLRVTYPLPEQRAKALVDFLQEHSEHDFETTIKEDQLILTAAPRVHEALAPFINTLLKHGN